MKHFRNRCLIGITAFGLMAGAFAAPGSEGANGHGGHEAKMGERAVQRQSELHDKLKLTGTQEAAWKTFIGKMKPSERPARPDRAAMKAASVPERMEMMLARMNAREKFMTDRLAAVREFYGVLSADQQKVFNAEFGRRPHHHRGS